MEEVEPLLGEEPAQYMKRCQQKMSELSGFKIYNAGYTEKCAFK